MTHYNFATAENHLNAWFSPQEMINELYQTAVKLSVIDAGENERLVREMQLAVVNVCDFLKTIKVEEEN